MPHNGLLSDKYGNGCPRMSCLRDCAFFSTGSAHILSQRDQSSKGSPSADLYERRFGSLRNAYAVIGYVPPVDYSYLETRGERISLIKDLAAEIATAVPNVNPDLIAEQAGGCLAVNDGSFISLRVVRSWQHSQRHCSAWTLRRGSKTRPSIAVLVRLDEQNKRPLDYIVAPTDSLPERPLIRPRRS